ncbi:hypothetical protein [Xenorhabdus indica]|uniref:hypothetical protein n=1 Tax=Xenorhabdus indica TaxID=333964 RepID=UPI001CA44C7A|nr:hypothetical protein [Xenorhabdus indica]MBC8944192.1 ATPase AAA [Xenorhabdus indica]
MASSEQLKTLLQSHLEKDDDRFMSVTLQIAAHEARQGHGKLAQEPRDIVHVAKKKAQHNLNAPISIDKGIQDTSGLLFTSYPKNNRDAEDETASTDIDLYTPIQNEMKIIFTYLSKKTTKLFN